MNPEFTEKMRTQLTEQKKAGWSAQDALRELERECGRNNEQFNPDGMPLVEEVFDGRFERQQASGWTPNRHDEEPAAGIAEPNEPDALVEDSSTAITSTETATEEE